MNVSLFLSRIGGRFHPATQQQFNKYAQHLGWAIRCDHIESREMLAHIYHYRNAYALEHVLKMPGTPGPFDDAIPLKIRGNKQLQRAIASRDEHAMKIIVDHIHAGRTSVQQKFTLQKLSALELFSSPLAHEVAFRTLVEIKHLGLSGNSALTH